MRTATITTQEAVNRACATYDKYRDGLQGSAPGYDDLALGRAATDLRVSEETIRKALVVRERSAVD